VRNNFLPVSKRKNRPGAGRPAPRGHRHRITFGLVPEFYGMAAAQAQTEGRTIAKTIERIVEGFFKGRKQPQSAEDDRNALALQPLPASELFDAPDAPDGLDSRDNQIADLECQLALSKITIVDSEAEIRRLEATNYQLEQTNTQLKSVQQHRQNSGRLLQEQLAAAKREFAVAWGLMHPGQRERLQLALLSAEQVQSRAAMANRGTSPGPLPNPSALA
jgi:hypothetical protein